MDDRFDQLSEAILHKDLQHCTVEELEDLVTRYPFFSAAHFLLLKKKQETGEDAEESLQRSMLYYHDPVSFGHFLQPQKTEDRFLYEAIKEIVPEQQPSERQALTQDALAEQEQEDIPTLQPTTLADPAEEKVAEPVTMPIEEKPVEEALAFEPFHTVDYFASQGIKPSKEEPKDAFGKQLKSFTEWLKTMKKLPDARLAAAQTADPAVDALADRSVTRSEVVTEAMAEVWIKQGNREKAIEIYRKLSLLDPSKTPYFAAKIDNLKAD